MSTKNDKSNKVALGVALLVILLLLLWLLFRRKPGDINIENTNEPEASGGSGGGGGGGAGGGGSYSGQGAITPLGPFGTGDEWDDLPMADSAEELGPEAGDIVPDDDMPVMGSVADSDSTPNTASMATFADPVYASDDAVVSSGGDVDTSTTQAGEAAPSYVVSNDDAAIPTAGVVAESSQIVDPYDALDPMWPNLLSGLAYTT